MSITAPGRESFVVFPLGVRRFALLTSDVVELSRAGLVQTFPHTTPGVTGVLVRRGEILPVWDVAEALLGSESVTKRFWLVTRRHFAGEEPTAIPVSGECQMLRAEMLPPPEGSAGHVRGVLVLEDQPVEVLDLARLAIPRGQAGSRDCAEKVLEG
jgi:chemotaxis signal transduction protein